MTCKKNRPLSRREFLRQLAVTTSALGMGSLLSDAYANKGQGSATRVIIIGIDGMDPRLCERLMDMGRLPNLAKLRHMGGYRSLGTSIPPQSPVAWANFITGSGPGRHGIFDFIHRDPERQAAPFFSIATTNKGHGHWAVGKHKIQMNVWPFNHTPDTTHLLRQGVPFWDYLDEARVESTFYGLPSNYPPSRSKHDHHHCLSGMGTPDLLGTNGTYQHFAENGPIRPKDEPGGRRSRLVFKDDTAQARLMGPQNSFLLKPEPVYTVFDIHRDKAANAAVIDIQGQRLLLKQGQWSPWIRLDFELSTPALIPNEHVHGICRFYMQEVTPNVRVYVSPINSDPSDSSLPVTEPAGFSKRIVDRFGLFGTSGFQEDHKAFTNGVFTDEEFRIQADMVLKERLGLFKSAMDDYDKGLLFFYFSSTDLQSHMFWWDTDRPHPTRSPEQAEFYFQHIWGLYQTFDQLVGDVLARYGDEATLIVMSDHGFANFTRQFNLNSWLRDNGYLGPASATSVLADVDWTKTRAFGMGLNGLYLNLKGREKEGIVAPGQAQEALITELCTKLEALRDTNGQQIIRKVYRSDEVYSGSATALAPDLIVGYRRGYRASWETCLGNMTKEVLQDNTSAWCADHCADAAEVPGVMFCNRPIAVTAPSLIDIGPTVLQAFGLDIPDSMEGESVFGL